MLTKDKAGEIFDKIKKHSSADEVEALFYGGHSALTRFANNTIHQNVAEEHYGVSVRTVFNGRTARASTNKLDEESLRRVVQASESLARVQHPDPDLLPMPNSGEGARGAQAIPKRHFEQTAAITPDQRALGHADDHTRDLRFSCIRSRCRTCGGGRARAAHEQEAAEFAECRGQHEKHQKQEHHIDQRYERQRPANPGRSFNTHERLPWSGRR